MTGQLFSLRLVFGFVLALGIFGCGKNGSDGNSSAAGDFTPPPNPTPTETTPSNVKSQINSAANAVKENLDDCRGSLSSPTETLSNLQSAREGKGASANCINPALKALQWLGSLEDKNYLTAQELSRFIRALVNWIHRLQSQPSQQAVLLVAFTTSNEGSHLVGGKACPSGTETAGGLADCGGGTCNGNTVLCKIRTPVDIAAQVVTDILITKEGLHKVGGPGCPAGYKAFASAADCGGGQCNGNQNFCMKTASARKGLKVVADYNMTREGLHVVGSPGCPNGWRVTGSVADCGGGPCNGNQVMCAEDTIL